MKGNPEIRLDIMVKKEEDYYMAHCLQFDLIATDDTRKGVQQAIVEVCVAHIQFSYKNNNMESLFSPAPKEAWAEYYTLLNDPNCSFDFKELKIAIEDETAPAIIPPFIVQEIYCHEQASCRA